MARKEIRAAAARSDGLLARLQGHATDPGANGAHAVYDRSFDERLKGVRSASKRLWKNNPAIS